MTQEPSYLIDVKEGHILLTPITDAGQKQKTHRLSIETADKLVEALRQAVLAAKIKFWA